MRVMAAPRKYDTWWPAIATFIRTRATNAKTEAANVTIKNIKRTGRGYRSHENYKCRIMLYNTPRRRRDHSNRPHGHHAES